MHLCQQFLWKSIRRIVARRVGERAAGKLPAELLAEDEKEDSVRQMIEQIVAEPGNREHPRGGNRRTQHRDGANAMKRIPR
jgi:hypothetical protein